MSGVSSTSGRCTQSSLFDPEDDNTGSPEYQNFILLFPKYCSVRCRRWSAFSVDVIFSLECKQSMTLISVDAHDIHESVK